MSSKKRNKLPEEQLVLLNNFKPKNKKQSELIELIENKEIIIAVGVAGSGKTITTLATALSLLGDVYKRIVLIKSVTTIPGEAIGFIPGSFEQKMEPFLMSYFDNIDKVIGRDRSKELVHKEIIKILPITYIRGLSLDNSIVVVDEAQNIDDHTFKTIITRIGENSKYIFLGDIEQVDRKREGESCLRKVFDLFSKDDLVGTIEFKDEDCVRNPLIPKILKKLRELNM